MTSPLSVLLIIGAAVLGPIEAQLVDDPNLSGTAWVAHENRCHEQGVFDLKKYNACMATLKRPESLPELCERAMREIGAEKLTIQSTSKQVCEGGVCKWRTDEEWQFKSQSVRCIPTPTGYHR